MRMHLIAICLLACLILSACDDSGTNPPPTPTPTTGIIKGKIARTATSEAVEGANVYTMPATSSTTSDVGGNYAIENVMPGQYIVVAGKADYSGSRMIRVTAGQTTTADIPLIQNRLPNSPVLVSPANNATGQAINLQLTWSCSDPDGDPLTYDVYIDSLCPPQNLVATNLQDTQFLARDLIPNKTYCWMVVAKDNKGGMMSGYEWRFTTASILFAATWDMSDDYSITNNPTGVWSYGRKWSADGSTFDLFTVRWDESGWYFGNVGHGGPSIMRPSYIVNLWAKNNSNGLPCVRWTSPESGCYNLSSIFIGGDSRGVDVVAYIAINSTIVFSDYITSYLDSTEYSIDVIDLAQGDHIDFVVKWNGGVYSEYSWTQVNAIINKF